MCDGYSNAYSVDIFWIRFHRNKIESCGFHRSKEEMKMRRILYYKFADMAFLRFSINLFGNKSTCAVFTVHSQFSGDYWNRRWKIYKTAEGVDTAKNHSGVIDVVVEALSIFSSNICEKL